MNEQVKKAMFMELPVWVHAVALPINIAVIWVAVTRFDYFPMISVSMIVLALFASVVQLSIIAFKWEQVIAMFHIFHRIRRVDAFASDLYSKASILAAQNGVTLTQDQMRQYARDAYVTASHLEDEARKRDGQGLTL